MACYIYPLPTGTEYTKENLKSCDTVIELFGYCEILEGLITKAGWQFLIDFYGYDKLYEMDKEALWYDGESIEDYINWVKYEIGISPEY